MDIMNEYMPWPSLTQSIVDPIPVSMHCLYSMIRAVPINRDHEGIPSERDKT
jgi:hypothetical protein